MKSTGQRFHAPDLATAFWRRVVESDGCWEFIGTHAGAAEYAVFERLIGVNAFVKANDRQDVGTLILPQVEVA